MPREHQRHIDGWPATCASSWSLLIPTILQICTDRAVLTPTWSGTGASSSHASGPCARAMLYRASLHNSRTTSYRSSQVHRAVDPDGLLLAGRYGVAEDRGTYGRPSVCPNGEVCR